jgi:glycosyltransferase involved in cell wall biosynthesis
MKPKASFIIPVFNGQPYIAQAINSCLNQTIKDIEVVVVNDGSTDWTGSILTTKAGEDKRLKIVTLEENGGRSNARNRGIEEAQADVLLMMDADDLSVKERAEWTLTYFKKNPEMSILSGHFLVMHELGEVFGRSDSRPFNWNTLKETGLAHIGHSTMAFRRKVFDQVRYTDGEFSKHGIDDWKFQVDAYKAGFEFGFIDKNLAIYRQIDKPRDIDKIRELKVICLN